MGQTFIPNIFPAVLQHPSLFTFSLIQIVYENSVSISII